MENLPQLTQRERVEFIVSPFSEPLSPTDARRAQFNTDCRAVCAYCAGKYADTSANVKWMGAYDKTQAGLPIGAYVHPVEGGHYTLCRASAIRIASPELQEQEMENANG